MRKGPMLFVLSLLFALAAGAQKAFENPNSLKTFVVQLSDTPAPPTHLPFRNIILVDSRFDTSKAGYVKTGRSYKKVATEKPFAGTLQTFLNRKYQLPADTSLPALLIVIKKFWLQESSLAEQKAYKMAKASSTTSEFASCATGFDVYMVAEENYIPVFKWDTVCTENSPLKKCVNRLITQPFEYCIAKIGRMDFSKIQLAKRKLAWSDIEQYNDQRFAFPRFKTETFEKGIYKTFQDFLQNKPAKQEFVIQYGAQTDEVFVTEAGTPVLLTEFWGVCNGGKNYVKIGFNIRELIKQNNTYDLWGSKFTIDKSFRNPAHSNTPATAIIGSALFNNNAVESNHKPLQLNMETGTVY